VQPDEEGPSDAVAGAFNAVADVGEMTARDAEELAKRSRLAGQERAAGASVRDGMVNGYPLEILALIETMAKRLVGAGAALRKALVQGLSQEGLGVSAVSRVFGVSHQRISALMQKARPK
jgi:hypothetical protein